jgi:hypothetical protein
MDGEVQRFRPVSGHIFCLPGRKSQGDECQSRWSGFGGRDREQTKVLGPGLEGLGGPLPLGVGLSRSSWGETQPPPEGSYQLQKNPRRWPCHPD